MDAVVAVVEPPLQATRVRENGMGRAGIESLLYMLDRNFAVPGPTFGTWHSFLVNLVDVRDDDWMWAPEGGERSREEPVLLPQDVVEQCP